MDDLFEGDALQKWEDVILHASQALVRQELVRLLEECALNEVLLEDLGLEDRLEMLQKRHRFDLDLQKRVRVKTIDLAIASMANILGHE